MANAETIVHVTADMMGRTCANCRWWDQGNKDADPGNWTHSGDDWGACLLSIGPHPEHGPTREHDPGAHRLMLAVDPDESIYGVLVTSPSFGCVQWEAKDGDDD